jgi:hypothetical protein
MMAKKMGDDFLEWLAIFATGNGNSQSPALRRPEVTFS